MDKALLIKSVSKSISVLQAINRHGSMSITNIARHGNLPYPTAFRIVQTLMHEGLIEQDPLRKHYRPTALVDSLAHGYRAESRIVDIAREPMSAFTREMGWPMFISVRVGTKMVVRHATHGETSLTFDLCYPGFTVPLLTSATGYALLAHLGDEDVRRATDWYRRAYPDAVELDEVLLHRKLAQVRAQGHAAKPCSSDTRSSSVAVPVLLADGRAEAVLTLTYFSAAMNEQTAIERYAPRLKQAARQIALNVEDAAYAC
ncbi:MAG TPA: helix-turn-helix domain-containing protein [Novosphingobium sp.]|nr:helix-turn-helix domain-containing protein [Novosphingobium sp.]